MENNCIYQFFNNSTIAVIIAVLIGACFAIFQYKKQKQIDRKNFQKREIINELILLQGKLQYSILILDRIANTYDLLVKDSEGIKEFISATKNYEIPKLSQTLNEDIPLLNMKIDNLICLYFSKRDVLNTYEKYKSELKKWHSFIVNEFPKGKFDFKKKSSEVPELKIESIENQIKKLIKVINDH